MELEKIKKKGSCFFIVVILLLSAIVGISKNADRAEGGEILWTYDADFFVRTIESADLTGDGIADIIAAEYDSDSYDAISNVYGIDGLDGSTLWTYQLNDGARSMTIGDINNDGVMDAVVGASKGSVTPDGKVHVINGVDGNTIWTFTPGSSGDTIGDVDIGDFNGDQYPDVAVACWDDFVYAVDGNTGSELWNYEIGSIFINAVSTNDVNGDGYDDVSYAHSYLAGYDNEIGVLDGTNGNVIWNRTITDTGEDSLLLDIDNDGDNEAIYGVIKDTDDVEVQVRSGINGSLEWSKVIGPGASGTNPGIFLFSHDIDQDSDLDLLIGNEYVDFYIRAFDGDSESFMWLSEELDGYPRDLSFGDINGNGYENIIAATYDRVQILNATNGLKGWYHSVAGTIRGTSVGDFDGDGINDVSCSGGAEFSGDDPSKAVWALKTIEVSPVLWEHDVGEYGNAVALGDFTGDSIFDVIAVTSNDKAWAMDGSSGEELWQWNDTDNLYTVTTGDFNGDGIDDAAVAGASNSVIALDGNDGSKLWEFAASDQFYRKCLKSVDLNNDGKSDVIAACDDSYVYAINGDTSSLLWSIDLDGSVRDINLYQMNSAGVLDVVAAASNEIVILDGANGNKLWEYTTDVSSAKHVDALDANNDGIMDIVWGSLYKVEVVDGGNQNLIWSQSISVNSDYCLSSGDMNGDGNSDVIIGGGSDDQNVIAADGLDGSILWEFPTGGDVNCVYTVDVDNNGDLDVLSGSDDQYVYVISSNGNEIWSYPTADDVMHLASGDLTGNTKPNIVALTFGFDGVVYAFRTLAEGGQPPDADFTYSPLHPTTESTIQFTDNSSDSDGNIVSWDWNFGDGNTSTVQNPTHSYQNKGTYTVSLMVTDNDEDTSTITQDIYVEKYGPIADFSFIPSNPLKNETIQFSDESIDTSTGSISSWLWEFGDGNTSTVQNPTHSYDKNGSYQVNLTVMNTTGASDTITKSVFVGGVNVDYSFYFGWNMISVPVTNMNNASDLAENISGCQSVSKWDSENQTYYTYIPGIPSFDFPLVDGLGYFVDVNQSSNTTLSGPQTNTVNVSLSVGWNMIGWYKNEDTTASSLAENISGCQGVSKWDAENQTFYTYIPGVPSFDFSISWDMGLFVDVNEASYWHGEG